MLSVDFIGDFLTVPILEGESFIMKKTLFCLFAFLFLLCVSACTPEQSSYPTQQEESSADTLEQPEDTETTEPITEATLMEINIYHLGIRTPLEANEEHALALAQQFIAMLENAAEMDSMEAPPEAALNPDRVMKGQTALEIIYAKKVMLPLIVDGETLTARRLLFSIPVSSSEGGLLYTGHDIYEETPLGRLFDHSLQNAIFNNASDQVERVTFAADGNEVIINGQSYHYESGDDAETLSGRLLNRILYRTIAFYLNANTGNVNGLQTMSTSTLYEYVLKANSGIETDNELGEVIIANFNKYVLTDYFQLQNILAPVKKDEEYQVLVLFTEQVSLEFNFTVEDDLPLVCSIKLIMPE